MNNINRSILHQLNLQRGLVFGILIVAALLSFEMFNYSTTDYALSDLLGDLEFLGIRWATILAIAFCGIDFAGIARLFTPEDGQEQPRADPEPVDREGQGRQSRRLDQRVGEVEWRDSRRDKTC